MEIKGEVYTGGGVCLLMVMVFERGQDTHIARHVRAFINVLYILSLCMKILKHMRQTKSIITRTRKYTQIPCPVCVPPPKKIYIYAL